MEGRGIEPGVHHPITGTPSDGWKTLLIQQLIGTFIETGKDKAVKGEGWALTPIVCAQDIVGL